MSTIAQHIEVSQRVEIEDLDWNLARKHGLAPEEIENLKFFADIESQTVYYFLEVAKLEVEDATERSTRIPAGARWKAKLEDLAQTMMARLMPKRFVSLWMFWGALQECPSLRVLLPPGARAPRRQSAQPALLPLHRAEVLRAGMAQLPGMAGLDACMKWARKIQPILPVDTRELSVEAERLAA